VNVERDMKNSELERFWKDSK